MEVTCNIYIFFQDSTFKGLGYHYMNIENDDIIVYVFTPKPYHNIFDFSNCRYLKTNQGTILKLIR